MMLPVHEGMKIIRFSIFFKFNGSIRIQTTLYLRYVADVFIIYIFTQGFVKFNLILLPISPGTFSSNSFILGKQIEIYKYMQNAYIPSPNYYILKY